LYDAVYTACHNKLLDVSRGQEPVRKAMVLISDGEDTVSSVYLDEAIKECQRAETIIYAISTNWTPSRGKGDKALTQMAVDTGGQVFFPPSAEEMSNSFHGIEEELRSQYALTYTPADFKEDGSFRPSISTAMTGATRCERAKATLRLVRQAGSGNGQSSTGERISSFFNRGAAATAPLLKL